MSQNNCPGSRKGHHLIPTTENVNIKHDYDNDIPVSNTSTHPNLITDNQHEKKYSKMFAQQSLGV